MNIPPDPTILRVAQGLTRDAWLLSRIIFWTRYTKVERDGHKWIVKTQEEWAAETGLPMRTVQRAFDSLWNNDVVAVERHLFGPKPINFIRIKAAAAAKLGLWTQKNTR